jgi:hypothetical protein
LNKILISLDKAKQLERFPSTLEMIDRLQSARAELSDLSYTMLSGQAMSKYLHLMSECRIVRLIQDSFITNT